MFLISVHASWQQAADSRSETVDQACIACLSSASDSPAMLKLAPDRRDPFMVMEVGCVAILLAMKLQHVRLDRVQYLRSILNLGST